MRRILAILYLLALSMAVPVDAQQSDVQAKKQWLYGDVVELLKSKGLVFYKHKAKAGGMWFISAERVKQEYDFRKSEWDKADQLGKILEPFNGTMEGAAALEASGLDAYLDNLTQVSFFREISTQHVMLVEDCKTSEAAEKRSVSLKDIENDNYQFAWNHFVIHANAAALAQAKKALFK